MPEWEPRPGERCWYTRTYPRSDKSHRIAATVRGPGRPGYVRIGLVTTEHGDFLAWAGMPVNLAVKLKWLAPMSVIDQLAAVGRK